MYIIHLGFSGFPYGRASVQRTMLTFKGLKLSGEDPLVINKISHHQFPANKKVYQFEDIVYINTSLLDSKPASFVGRNLNKLSGYIGELYFLYRKRKKIQSAILYSTYFLEYPYYFILSRLFRFKLVVQYVEMFSSIPGRNSFFTKMNDRLIDRYLWRFCDGVIAISNYLVEHLTLLSPLTPVIKIPVNSDYAKIAELAASKEKNYLMYCGTIYYEEVIEFIISLFVLLKSNGVYEGALLLIVSGDHSENQDKLDEFLKNVSFRKDIIIKSDIPETELFGYYKSADVLLIPLRDTVQDIARFPHKIGEYTAAGRPLLSTNVGELKNYFKDGVSAILADAYSVESYYHKILPFISSRQKLDQIGREGQAIGKSNFDFRGQGEKLKAFIDSLPAV